MFFTGQKVVCICDVSRHTPYPEVFPKKDHIYTIRQLITMDYQCCRLTEIVNQEYFYREFVGELMFSVYAFRPLVNRKTSIEVFEKMLNQIEEKVK